MWLPTSYLYSCGHHPNTSSRVLHILLYLGMAE